VLKENFIQKKKIGKKMFCPKGYHQVGTRKCIKVIKCPKGFKKTQRGCKRVRITRCPFGYRRIKKIDVLSI